MRLRSLRLRNFRQHAETSITFERGLTGIIGANGSGKSTILEAIAWALYGNAAARGTRDGIRYARAAARAAVRVELDFDLAGHHYRVVRGLTSAECYLDAGETPIANTITGVTELLQRRLGMTRAEFFHTYFTEQKELDVMQALGPAERARFLSRVLGYDRLSGAQELARERRRALVAESSGVRQGMPDPAAILRAAEDAEAQLAAARVRVEAAERAMRRAADQRDAVAPRWRDAQARREQAQQLVTEQRVAESEALAKAREVDRLEAELEGMAAAQQELAPMRAQLAGLPALRAALATQDALASAEAERRALLERVAALTEEEATLAERAGRLETAPQLERESHQQLQTLRQVVAETERILDAERTAWTRDGQEAETRLAALRTQYAELTEQQATLEGLGEASPCPTCNRPLGASYRGVLELLREQRETVRVDGNYYRQRVEQLAAEGAAIEAREAARRQQQQELAAAERRHARIQGAVAEAVAVGEQRARVGQRIAEATRQLAVVPVGYDAARHAALREDVAGLQALDTRAARIGALIEREGVIRADLQQALAARDAARERLLVLQARRDAIGLDEAEFQAARDAHEQAEAESRRAELEAVAASSETERARMAVEAAEQGRRMLARLQTTLDALESEKTLQDELDRALTDLRTDLNFQLRPELAEIASGFLAELTDGRYSALEFDEDYRLLVLEDGVPKPVISGGEEDLCNLVLRLAISQMIAERAGQAFSLLILDEVFGSLDEMRRANVVELLRRLNDRFEQVIVITHIDGVREGLDRLLQVRFDEARGCSVVTEVAAA